MVNESPYDDLIMDHIRNARHYRVLDNANYNASGSNPLCGDGLILQLRIAHGRIEDLGFQCECCGISMASSSMMAERISGREVAEVRQLIRAVAASLAANPDTVPRAAEPLQRALLATVRDFPARRRCAELPWLTLEAALENRQDTAYPV